MQELLAKLKVVEKFAQVSKLSRFIKHPFKYLELIPIKLSKSNKQGVLKKAMTFWGEYIHLLLPASTDIFLSGGKTHDSEIRLSKFAIQTIQPNAIVLDIGAHFGFFSMLFAKLTPNGKVHSFEASIENYKILSLNCCQSTNIVLNQIAVSNQVGDIEFYEFPSAFSEYNSMDEKQYQNETWFQENKPNILKVSATTLDEYCSSNNIIPQFIKIDVEGAEDKVIDGLIKSLTANNLIIVMEYVDSTRNNENHKKALILLRNLGYSSHIIDKGGNLNLITDVDLHLNQNNLESDNIVFNKY